MKNTLVTKALWSATVAAFALLCAGAIARDVRDGKVDIRPAKGDDKFEVNGFIMGKAQLFGYISDLKANEGLKTVVFKLSSRGTAEQRRAVGSIARTLDVEAVDEDGNDLKALATPPPPAAPAVPAAPAAPAAPTPPAPVDGVEPPAPPASDDKDG
ncbi:MAG: hypothetical protein ABI451_00240 [Dokdonella sp.]